jgi:hypothetical protein
MGGAVALVVAAAALPIVLSRSGRKGSSRRHRRSTGADGAEPGIYAEVRQTLQNAGYTVDYIPASR